MAHFEGALVKRSLAYYRFGNTRGEIYRVILETKNKFFLSGKNCNAIQFEKKTFRLNIVLREVLYKIHLMRVITDLIIQVIRCEIETICKIYKRILSV